MWILINAMLEKNNTHSKTCVLFGMEYILRTLIATVALQHWDNGVMTLLKDRVTHICVAKLTVIASDNGLSPERRQAIVWTMLEYC